MLAGDVVARHDVADPLGPLLALKKRLAAAKIPFLAVETAFTQREEMLVGRTLNL